MSRWVQAHKSVACGHSCHPLMRGISLMLFNNTTIIYNSISDFPSHEKQGNVLSVKHETPLLVCAAFRTVLVKVDKNVSFFV